jgi:hypothetical protein
MNRTSTVPLKAVAVGALCGLLVFLGLSAVTAQSVLTVAQLETNPRAYVGTTVQITGLVQNVRNDTRRINGKDVPYVKLNLYKVDAKGRKAPRYVYVSLPAKDYQTPPVEGQMMAVTGPLKWAYEIAAIDP